MSDHTKKEQEVAACVARGLTNKQIAATMGVSMQRVRILITAVAFKIGADADKDERVQVALWWHRTHDVAKPHSA